MTPFRFAIQLAGAPTVARWRELARTFSIDDDAEEALRRLEARLRKRFQHIKEEILSRALEAGLLGTSHDDG